MYTYIHYRMREEEHERELENMRMMMFAKAEVTSIAQEKAALEQARKQLQVCTYIFWTYACVQSARKGRT